MTKSVHIDVQLDSKLWWQLTTVAERHNMTVAVLLSELGQKLVASPIAKQPRGGSLTKGTSRPTYSRDELNTQVALLYGKKFSDAQIAAEIGCSAETVRQRRVALGLPPRGRFGQGRSKI